MIPYVEAQYGTFLKLHTHTLKHHGPRVKQHPGRLREISCIELQCMIRYIEAQYSLFLKIHLHMNITADQ